MWGEIVLLLLHIGKSLPFFWQLAALFLLPFHNENSYQPSIFLLPASGPDMSSCLYPMLKENFSWYSSKPSGEICLEVFHVASGVWRWVRTQGKKLLLHFTKCASTHPKFVTIACFEFATVILKLFASLKNRTIAYCNLFIFLCMLLISSRLHHSYHICVCEHVIWCFSCGMWIAGKPVRFFQATSFFLFSFSAWRGRSGYVYNVHTTITWSIYCSFFSIDFQPGKSVVLVFLGDGLDHGSLIYLHIRYYIDKNRYYTWS